MSFISVLCVEGGISCAAVPGERREADRAKRNGAKRDERTPQPLLARASACEYLSRLSGSESTTTEIMSTWWSYTGSWNSRKPYPVEEGGGPAASRSSNESPLSITDVTRQSPAGPEADAPMNTSVTVSHWEDRANPQEKKHPPELARFLKQMYVPGELPGLTHLSVYKNHAPDELYSDHSDAEDGDSTMDGAHDEDQDSTMNRRSELKRICSAMEEALQTRRRDEISDDEYMMDEGGAPKKLFKNADSSRIDHDYRPSYECPDYYEDEEGYWKWVAENRAPVELDDKDDMKEELIKAGAQACLNNRYDERGGPQAMKNSMLHICYKCTDKTKRYHMSAVALMTIIDENGLEKIRFHCRACWTELTGKTSHMDWRRAKAVHTGTSGAIKPMTSAEQKAYWSKAFDQQRKAGNVPIDPATNKQMKRNDWHRLMVNDKEMQKMPVYMETMLKIRLEQDARRKRMFSLYMLMSDHMPMVVGNEKSQLAVINKYMCLECRAIFQREGMWYSMATESGKPDGWACVGHGGPYKISDGMLLTICERVPPQETPGACRKRPSAWEQENDSEEPPWKVSHQCYPIEVPMGACSNVMTAMKMTNTGLADELAFHDGTTAKYLEKVMDEVCNQNFIVAFWLEKLPMKTIRAVSWKDHPYYKEKKKWAQEIYQDARFSTTHKIAGERMVVYDLTKLEGVDLDQKLKSDQVLKILYKIMADIDNARLLSCAKLLHLANSSAAEGGYGGHVRAGMKLIAEACGVLPGHQCKYLVEAYEDEIGRQARAAESRARRSNQ